jgi:uncharacterized protein (TIGR00730 family)
MIRKICVYCGSGQGDDPAFTESAESFGALMAARGIGLIYGGGNLGLMGTIARSVLSHGGHVTGIIPEFLKSRERMLQGAQDLIITDDMHERKRLMFEKADAFVALPGGIGTLEELVEQMTWAQLERHTKPIVLANIAGFWTPLLGLLQHMRDKGFIRHGFEVKTLVADRVEDIIPMIESAYASDGARQEKDPLFIS